MSPAVENAARISDAERAVLRVLVAHHGDFGVLPFLTIQADAEMERAPVRRACRSLARKGFAEFVRGCWTEDGTPAGSGYEATKAGCAVLPADDGSRISA